MSSGVNKNLAKNLIIGNGAVGSFLHSLLSKSFRLISRNDSLRVHDNALIIIATKAYDLVNVLDILDHKKEYDILLVHNGYLDDVLKSYSFNFYRLILDFGIEKQKEGFMLHGQGAFYTNHDGVAQLLIGKAEVHYFEDIHKMLWKKLIANSIINPLSAAYRIKNKDILLYEEEMRALFNEGLAIANSELEDQLTCAEVHDYVRSVIEKTGENTSSMLQDIAIKKKTEIEFITGAIIRLGKRYGIPTPANQKLYENIKSIEASYLC